jgi:hypothetical protein
VEQALIELKTPKKASKRAQVEITTALEEDIRNVSFIFFLKQTADPFA